MTPTPRPLVLITGASRGIGAATARALAPTHRLVLLGRDADALDGVARDLDSARVVTVDLTDPDAVREALLTAAPDVLDSLAGLVHCAGTVSLAPVAAATDTAALDEWRHVYETNVVAVVSLTALLLPALRAARGHVVAVNSTAGLRANPTWGAYAASKYALRAFADSLRAEEPAIRVSSVHPGRTDTDMQRAVVAAEGGEYAPGRFLSPASVARTLAHCLTAPADSDLSEVVLRPDTRGDLDR